jgi:signal transduction histidine kinase
MRIHDIRPPEDVQKLDDYLLMSRAPYRRAGTWRHRRRNGDVIEVEITSHTLDFAGRKGVLVAAHDLTEQRRLEEQLIQSQKMDAIGRLAGGIAHDFNNILTTIQGYCELVLQHPLLAPVLRDDLEQIKHAAVSATSLTKQLLGFSRKQIAAPVVLDFNTVLHNLARMIPRVVGEDIRNEPRGQCARCDAVGWHHHH